MSGGITFNGNNLQTAQILTQVIDHGSHPVKNISPIALSHANKSVIPSIYHPNKLITVSGIVLSTVSIADLDATLDTFRSYFNGNNLNLDIEYNGSTRRFFATATNVSIVRPGGLLHAEFQVQFFCADPFGWDTAATTVLNDTGVTSVSYSPTFTLGGTAPIQQPLITLTYTALSGNTGQQTVLISNQATGQTISITRAWLVNDVIIIDVYNKIVTVNSISVPFTGAFPEFKPGAGGFGYSDAFTTRTFNFNVVCTKAYL